MKKEISPVVIIAAIAVVVIVAGFFIYKAVSSTETVSGEPAMKLGPSDPKGAPPAAGGEMNRYKEMQQKGMAPPMPGGQAAPGAPAPR